MTVMSFLNTHLCTLLVLAHSHSQCADLPVKFHWGSPHFSTSLLSPSSLTPLFITIFPSSSAEGREDLSLTWLTLPNDGHISDEDSFFSRDQGDRRVVTLSPACLGQKIGMKEECCPICEFGDRLMMLPEDVLAVWRVVNPSQSHSSLPPPLLFSIVLHLAAFRA